MYLIKVEYETNCYGKPGAQLTVMEADAGFSKFDVIEDYEHARVNGETWQEVEEEVDRVIECGRKEIERRRAVDNERPRDKEIIID